MSNLPAGADGVYFAPCGCEWSGGSWGICAAHTKPHSEHTQDSPAPWCDDCAIPFVDDEEDEAEQELERQSQEMQSRVDAASDWAKDEAALDAGAPPPQHPHTERT
jgi:hypothetical protein